MTRPLFIAMPGNEQRAARLAALTGGEVCALEMHTFPDGETCPRLMQSVSGGSVAMVCTLNQPNEKFMPLAFAAEAAREQGAHKIGLIAPYLAYMRQDMAFRPGEAVTSRTFSAMVSRTFDWLITVDPHLHRTRSLSEIYSIPSRTVHAGPAIAAWIKESVTQPFLIGPDEESRQWVTEVAARCHAPFAILSKERLGDRDVRTAAGHLLLPDGATPVLLDDIVSSGGTMVEAIRSLRPQPSRAPIIIAIHGVFASGAEQAIREAGARLITSNSVPGPHAAIDVDSLIAPNICELVR